jgi:chloramphenicol-sensitive protein RarD
LSNKGVLFGIAAYLIWGFFPIYFKTIQVVPAAQIMFHRIVWSFLLLVILVVFRGQWRGLRDAITGPRMLFTYTIAACLLAINWLTYVWGVNAGFVVETSLGYFINPLVSVALGVVILKERLRPMQWLPVGLAAAGVLYLTIQLDALPWIALVLAFSFGLYGLLKKISPLGSLYGLTLETGVLFLPAVGYLLYTESQGYGAFGHVGPLNNLLLALAGLFTTTPLLMFSSAARSIPLSLLGLLQYIAPTCQFLLGVLLYKEPFSQVQWVGFGIIWMALLLYTVEGFIVRRRRMVSTFADKHLPLPANSHNRK